jgi:hypothetical protein
MIGGMEGDFNRRLPNLTAVDRNDQRALVLASPGNGSAASRQAERTDAVVIDPLMGWFVLRLLADFFFRADNLAEAIAAIRPEAFIASGHAFIAGRQ